jgi:hypothetical protein
MTKPNIHVSSPKVITASPEVALLRNYLVSPEKSAPFQPLDYATLTKVLRIPEQPLAFFTSKCLPTSLTKFKNIASVTKPGQNCDLLAPFVNSSSGFAMQQALSQRAFVHALLRPSIPLIEMQSYSVS